MYVLQIDAYHITPFGIVTIANLPEAVGPPGQYISVTPNRKVLAIASINVNDIF